MGADGLPPPQPFARLEAILDRSNAQRDKAQQYALLPEAARKAELAMIPASEFVDTFEDVLFLLQAVDQQSQTILNLGTIMVRAKKLADHPTETNLDKLKAALKDPAAYRADLLKRGTDAEADA